MIDQLLERADALGASTETLQAVIIVLLIATVLAFGIVGGLRRRPSTWRRFVAKVAVAMALMCCASIYLVLRSDWQEVNQLQQAFADLAISLQTTAGPDSRIEDMTLSHGVSARMVRRPFRLDYPEVARLGVAGGIVGALAALLVRAIVARCWGSARRMA